MTHHQYPQSYFSAQQTAYRMVLEYSKKNVAEKGKIRHISDQLPAKTQRSLLEKAIAEEIYILDVSKLPLYESPQLHKMARLLNISTTESHDNVHLAWEIAMVIVRDKIAYKFNNDRQLVILKRRKH